MAQNFVNESISEIRNELFTKAEQFCLKNEIPFPTDKVNLFLSYQEILACLPTKFYENKPFKKMISSKALIQDLHLLEKMLPKIYGGYEIAASRGLDWSKLFLNWRNVLLSAKPFVCFEEAIKPWENFEDVQIDNHFSIGQTRFAPQITINNYNLDNNSFNWTIKGNVGSKQGVLPDQNITVSPKKIEIENLKKEAEKEKQIIDDFGDSNNVCLKKIEDFLYFRIPTMNSEKVDQLQKLSLEISKYKSKAVIVDIRNNGGFNCLPFLEAIKKLANIKNDFEPEIKFNLKFKDNLFTQLLSRNINWLEYVTNNDITSESIEEMVHLNVDQKWTKYSSINHYRNNMRDNINTIILIVNRFTASDAEAITLWVSTLKNSWIIGENTAGTCEFIRPGFFFLPSSGIPTMIPQGVNLGLPAGFTRLDGYGYPPDIYLEKDRWGADSIMKLSYQLLQRRKINP